MVALASLTLQHDIETFLRIRRHRHDPVTLFSWLNASGLEPVMDHPPILPSYSSSEAAAAARSSTGGRRGGSIVAADNNHKKQRPMSAPPTEATTAASPSECSAATGAFPDNPTCAQHYVGKSQSCMVMSGRLIGHAPVLLRRMLIRSVAGENPLGLLFRL